MKRLEAIADFLNDHALNDIAKLFNHEMEVQVNVGIDGGKKVERETQSGQKWWGYQKDEKGEIWKPIRVPYRAKENNAAEYEDRELTFSTSHFEAIGMTGWNWVNRESWWVGFDFDSIANHAQGLTDEDLHHVRNSLESIPWVTVRRSTSGKGLHFYIFLNPVIQTASHTEHAALARAILGILSAKCGIRLEAKVDVCGGVLWVWHRKQGEDGFVLVKQGTETLSDVPSNWRDHITALTGRKRQKPPTIGEGDSKSLDELVDRTKSSPLDDEHRRLFGWLAENNCLWWWDQDRNIFVAHTFDLTRAHIALQLKGPYYTIATGKEKGNDQNCFGFPLRNGGWVIRRHTRRTLEHPAWTVDSSGWTRCYFNIPADLATAARCHNGVERADGHFEIPTVEEGLKALSDLGAPMFEYPDWMRGRSCLIKPHKDGRAILKIKREPVDPAAQGWTTSKDNYHEKIISIQNEQPETEVPDHLIRHLIAGGCDAGWYLSIRGTWIKESSDNIRKALIANGHLDKLTSGIQGQCIMHPWYMVMRPFQPEYPGNRQWNREAAQFAYEPRTISGNLETDCPNWMSVFEHCGETLKEACENSKWCKEYDIRTGRDYLFLWAASMFQFPLEPLPYLFFYGPQNSGKTTFHQCLSLMFKNGVGYIKGEVALISSSRFNAELLNAVLVIVEETNIRVHKDAYNRIKDWVTSKNILIHEKGKTPYQFNNMMHWVQCANEPDACPVFPGDTRIVVSFVPELKAIIPQSQLMALLEVEAPAMLYYLLNVNIPPTNDRLRVPVITSAEKLSSEYGNELPVNAFFSEKVYHCPGNAIHLNELFNFFHAWLPSEQKKFWNYQRFMRCLPDSAPTVSGAIPLIRGRYKGPHYHAGNIALDPDTPSSRKLIKVYDKLVEEFPI